GVRTPSLITLKHAAVKFARSSEIVNRKSEMKHVIHIVLTSSQVDENIEKFITEFARALHGGTFVKMTLGNYKGTDAQLQKILVRLVKTRKGERLYFLYREDTRDTAKNFDLDTGVALISEALDGQFFS